MMRRAGLSRGAGRPANIISIFKHHQSQHLQCDNFHHPSPFFNLQSMRVNMILISVKIIMIAYFVVWPEELFDLGNLSPMKLMIIIMMMMINYDDGHYEDGGWQWRIITNGEG